jgi:meso-butanediol dehydrogenase/(S,S)-butanediol dehydrogenase/diacetyl reductase
MSRAAIVTGAASGIGRATVERLVAGGVGVVAVDLDAGGLGWVDDHPAADRIDTVVGDVSDPATSERAVRVALDRFDRLDAAALNAGLAVSGGLLDLPLEAFDRAIDVNLRGAVHGLRAVVPAMRAVGGGRVVVTASTSGLGGDPGLWAYNTAKGAVVNLVRAAAVDLGADGITVNAVCPGPTETAMTARLQQLPEAYEDLRRAIPLQRWGTPDDIAAVIVFLLSPDAGFVNGAVVPVDGGITASTGQFTPRPRPDLEREMPDGEATRSEEEP